MNFSEANMYTMVISRKAKQSMATVRVPADLLQRLLLHMQVLVPETLTHPVTVSAVVAQS